MGLTERHWFENEDVPENYEWELEDAVYNSRTNKKVKLSEEMQMIDREKVIEGLNNIKGAIIAAICYEDGYGSEHDLNCLDDAITLLKAQEPRMITLTTVTNGEHK